MKKENLDDIYQSYMEDIYFYIFSLCRDPYLAEDIMQETFYRAYLYLEDCREERVKPWLFRVAHNAFIDVKRKESRSSAHEHGFFEVFTDGKTPEEEFIMHERLEALYRSIESLPDRHKQALLLHDLHGFSYQEASDIMGVRLGYFKVLLFRARQEIRLKDGKDD